MINVLVLISIGALCGPEFGLDLQCWPLKNVLDMYLNLQGRTLIHYKDSVMLLECIWVMHGGENGHIIEMWDLFFRANHKGRLGWPDGKILVWIGEKINPTLLPHCVILIITPFS